MTGSSKDDWFVVAAEHPFVPRDPALRAEIDAVKAKIDERVRVMVEQSAARQEEEHA